MQGAKAKYQRANSLRVPHGEFAPNCLLFCPPAAVSAGLQHYIWRVLLPSPFPFSFWRLQVRCRHCAAALL